MRLKSTKSTIAVLAAAMGLIVAVSGGLFWVQRGWLVDATAELAAKETELSEGERIASRREEARQALEADKALIANLEPGVTDSAYVPTLLKQLEVLATATRNKVVGVRPQVAAAGPTKIQQRRDPNAQAKAGDEAVEAEEERKAAEPYNRLEIEVNLVGRFDTTQRFVDQLMRFPKIISVDQLTIKPKTGSGTTETPRGLLDVQLKVTAFIMKGDAPAQAPTTREVASAKIGGMD